MPVDQPCSLLRFVVLSRLSSGRVISLGKPGTRRPELPAHVEHGSQCGCFP